MAYFLGVSEPEMAKNGAAMTIDLDSFRTGVPSGTYQPNTVLDIFKNIVPYISTMISTIRRNYNMYPTYIVTGLKTASLLRSLQEFATNIPDVRGQIGFSGGTSQFMQMKVLESTVIEDNKMYFSTKAPQNSLEKSSILDIVYQPLYIIKEITDGNTRQFVRSRSMIEVVRTDGMGYIELKNINKYVG